MVTDWNEQETLEGMLEEIDEDGEGLSEWEVEFVAGLIDGWDGNFTRKQANVIERIYEQKV